MLSVYDSMIFLSRICPDSPPFPDRPPFGQKRYVMKQNGKIQRIEGVLTEMKKKIICFTAVLLLLSGLILAGCSSGGSAITSFDDVNKSSFRLGAGQGSLSQIKAEERFPEAQIHYFETTPDGYAAVLAGKIDGFAFDKVILEHYIRSSDGDAVLMDESYGTCNLSMGIAKDDKALLNRVNSLLRQMKEDGTLDDMINRWLHTDDPQMPELRKPENPSGTLRILSEGLTPPFTYISGGECTGLDIELGARLAYSMNMDYSVQNMGFGALLPALKAGKGDIIISELNETEERKKEISFTDPYYVSELGIVVKSDRYKPSGEGQTITKTDSSSGAAGIFKNIKKSFYGSFIKDARWKLVAEGLMVTIVISVLAYILGSLWGAVLCMMNRSKHAGLHAFATVYTRVVTGIPVLVWLMILYYIVFRGFDIPGIAVAVIGFALTGGASLSGIFDAGLNAVDNGQREAAAALGFKPFEVFRKIVFPQAAKHAFELYKGHFVALVKETSVVGYIAIMDLTKVSDIIRSRTYQAFFPLVTTALIYFAITCVFIAILTIFQRRFDPERRKHILKGVKTR